MLGLRGICWCVLWGAAALRRCETAGAVRRAPTYAGWSARVGLRRRATAVP